MNDGKSTPAADARRVMNEMRERREARAATPPTEIFTHESIKATSVPWKPMAGMSVTGEVVGSVETGSDLTLFIGITEGLALEVPHAYAIDGVTASWPCVGDMIELTCLRSNTLVARDPNQMTMEFEQ